MEKLNLLLDFVLIGVSVWMVYSIKNVGGIVGSIFSIIAVGSIILGSAHIIETFTFEVLSLDIVLVEFIHRIIVVIGLVTIAVGFKKIPH